jgi:hypothetical protein
VHRGFGNGSFSEYVERSFGYFARITHDELRVVEALEHLPELSRDLGGERVTSSRVRDDDAVLLSLAVDDGEDCQREADR